MSYFNALDGTRIYYEAAGKGLPIIALPGLTRNTRDFDHVAPYIEGRFIRMDYRGRGQSDWADHSSYTIAQEGQDVIALMDHLGIESAAFLGTSRGGLIAMHLAAVAPVRLRGVALNDIGPVIDPAGLAVIKDYIGRNPAQKTYAEAAKLRARTWAHFENVPICRWLVEVQNHYLQTPSGLRIRYDPALRQAVLEASGAVIPDLWPLFDALDGLPLALIRGANSDLLSSDTAAKMAHRRPDMIYAEIAGRGHVPFLDEPQAISALQEWIGRLA
jgi:pimeloyl-ACP methyl ester carboxylesterase